VKSFYHVLKYAEVSKQLASIALMNYMCTPQYLLYNVHIFSKRIINPHFRNTMTNCRTIEV